MKFGNHQVRKLQPWEWARLSEDAHLINFGENRPASLDRIDFALITIKEGKPAAWCTVRELDSESIYWQYGGALPNIEKSVAAFSHYKRFAEWSFANGYKRVTTYVENTNIRMLKMAFQVGFRIIGTRHFKGHVLVELLNEPGTETAE